MLNQLAVSICPNTWRSALDLPEDPKSAAKRFDQVETASSKAPQSPPGRHAPPMVCDLTLEFCIVTFRYVQICINLFPHLPTLSERRSKSAFHQHLANGLITSWPTPIFPVQACSQASALPPENVHEDAT